MGKFCLIVCIISLGIACSKAPVTTVSVHINGKAVGDPSLYTPDSTYRLTLDSTGSAAVILADGFKAGYAELRYGLMKLPLYLEPDKSFDVSLGFKGRKVMPEFAGAGAAVNEYLNKQHREYPDFKLDETQFIKVLEDMEKAEYARLDSLGFSDEFVNIEKQRLHYLIYNNFKLYPGYHAYYTRQEDFEPSEIYYNRMRSLIREDESLLILDEYRSLLAAFVQTYSTKDLETQNALAHLKAKLDYIDKNMNNPAVVSFLVNRFVTDYVSRAGIDDLPEYEAFYNAKVISPEDRAKFKEICAEWAKVKKGQASPAFRFADIDGKEVGLQDFAGKYVMIDVWATWCPPCRAEIPALKKLEQQFKDKNIVFVSISCDQKIADWEKMVREDGLGGIQLHNGGDEEFMNAYRIRSIPRFILLDREGNIISANMTRPSNPETVKTLENLEGI